MSEHEHQQHLYLVSFHGMYLSGRRLDFLRLIVNELQPAMACDGCELAREQTTLLRSCTQYDTPAKYRSASCASSAGRLYRTRVV